MIKFLQQRRATLTFIVLTVVMLVLMSKDVADRGGSDVAGDLLFKAGAPAVHASSYVTNFMGSLFRNYIDLREVRRENRRLSEALLRTEQERDRLREMAGAGNRLQALLGLRESLPLQTVAARVVGSGIASGGATLLIDRGAADGVRAGMPVIAVGGVIGRVIKVSADLGKVHCITDSASGVAIIVQESGYQGILFGTNRGTCEIHYLPSYAEVSHGDLVVTSGLDQIYPRGLPVGRVVGKVDGEGVRRRYEVKPQVDFQKIAEVLVVKTPPRLSEVQDRALADDRGEPAVAGEPGAGLARSGD